MAAHIMTGPFCPPAPDDKITIPLLMTKYNPDSVPADKVVHLDTIANKSLTYGGLREQAARCAWGLQYRMGMKEQDKLLVILPNSTDFIILAHATLWLGAIFSPLNTSSLAKDIAHALALVQPSHIAIDPSKLEAVNAAFQQLGWEESARPKVFTVLRRSGNLKLFPDDIAGQTPDQSLPPFDLGGRSTKDVTGLIVFSSGTTGKIKGVQLSHYNVVSNILQTRISMPWMMNHASREVFFPPYCHVYGLGVVVFNGMWIGSFSCGIPAFDLDLFCRKMEEHQATWAHIVPPVAIQLANSDIAAKYELSSMKIILISAAPTKRDLQMKLKARFGRDVKIVQAGYGMSECSPTVLVQSPLDDENNIGTAGKPVCGTELRLVDPVTLKDVAPGEEGELWVRGPQTMMGYYNNEQATRETYVNDWLRTGDIMRVDENGNFWVTDRLKELIKYKGFQVPPSELEDLLLRHPSVVDAAVTSIYSDEQATELPIAYVTLPATTPASQKQGLLAEIRSWADGQVAGYKKLRGGVFELSSLPKTPSGKILRRELPCKKAQSEGRAAKI
ncbi:uncharacterized protein Z520_11129 [Fonsecaea multimorphosa CBS 102226]|uniref:AMP-dependent synthetase/ligase domain-containing protein n=1 Tax=Fonsecaea multimorphosa CBS 102226 TaxID=1442371 RepID=A0A0D2JIR4_9EURO|nr:uncharacterized protein Z520_11129 [Fonsecaea multimorphosa CBS 102226]KIX93072.1 hypothetical protein Z520_11129 [Fonsecaea multimorphosa CBS 102226]